MKRELINKLCCPIDKNDLNLRVFVKHEDGDIIEGLLSCPECSRYFPIIHGIPIMTPDEYRDKSIEAPTLERWGILDKLADANDPDQFLLGEALDALSTEDVQKLAADDQENVSG